MPFINKKNIKNYKSIDYFLSFWYNSYIKLKRYKK